MAEKRQNNSARIAVREPGLAQVGAGRLAISGEEAVGRRSQATSNVLERVRLLEELTELGERLLLHERVLACSTDLCCGRAQASDLVVALVHDHDVPRRNPIAPCHVKPERLLTTYGRVGIRESLAEEDEPRPMRRVPLPATMRSVRRACASRRPRKGREVGDMREPHQRCFKALNTGPRSRCVAPVPSSRSLCIWPLPPSLRSTWADL
jgi:hypothetical protein